MSYVLINGKRYYKDDRTGRTTLDNVSQAEADRRIQRNQMTARTTGTAGATVHIGFLWKVVIACAVIFLFIGAIFYNRFHVSSEEQAITNYMNVQQAAGASNTVEAETVLAEDVQDANTVDEIVVSEENTALEAYLMPDSAERYLDTSEIEGYSHDEIQMIINELYARHGREFKKQENIDYFSAQDWYQPVSGKTDEAIVSEFNEFEKANVELLCEYL